MSDSDSVTRKSKVPAPPASLILSTPVHLLAYGFGSGCAPVAPGTFGTVLGVPLFLALGWLDWPVYLLVTGLLFGAGCWICGESARLLKLHDAPGIVFDEIVGYLVAAAPLLPVFGLAVAWPLWAQLLAAFVLFRVFDILKPWPIRWLDRRVHGGFGIMVDDLLAGVFAALPLWAALYAFG